MEKGQCGVCASCWLCSQIINKRGVDYILRNMSAMHHELTAGFDSKGGNTVSSGTPPKKELKACSSHELNGRQLERPAIRVQYILDQTSYCRGWTRYRYPLELLWDFPSSHISKVTFLMGAWRGNASIKLRSPKNLGPNNFILRMASRDSWGFLTTPGISPSCWSSKPCLVTQT